MLVSMPHGKKQSQPQQQYKYKRIIHPLPPSIYCLYCYY